MAKFISGAKEREDRSVFYRPVKPSQIDWSSATNTVYLRSVGMKYWIEQAKVVKAAVI